MVANASNIRFLFYLFHSLEYGVPRKERKKTTTIDHTINRYCPSNVNRYYRRRDQADRCRNMHLAAFRGKIETVTTVVIYFRQL